MIMINLYKLPILGLKTQNLKYTELWIYNDKFWIFTNPIPRKTRVKKLGIFGNQKRYKAITFLSLSSEDLGILIGCKTGKELPSPVWDSAIFLADIFGEIRAKAVVFLERKIKLERFPFGDFEFPPKMAEKKMISDKKELGFWTFFLFFLFFSVVILS